MGHCCSWPGNRSRRTNSSPIFASLSGGRDLPKPPATAPSPFGLADPDLGRAWLTEAGFTDIDHRSVTGTFELGTDADDAFAFAGRLSVVQGLISDLDTDAKAAALAALHHATREHETEDGVVFRSATWFITARRP